VATPTNQIKANATTKKIASPMPRGFFRRATSQKKKKKVAEKTSSQDHLPLTFI
jgi:hypothetical protein